MKIRNKLTLLFTCLIAVLLLVLTTTVYLTYSENRQTSYFQELQRTAITKANLLLDAKIAPHVLQLIYKSTANKLYPEEVAIYDTDFNLLYHDAVNVDKVKETRAMIDEIIRNHEIRFIQQDLQVVGFLYKHHEKSYVITAAAKDVYGLQNAETLRYTLILGFLISIGLVFISGRLFAKKALQPVSALLGKAEEISAKNLDARLPEGNGKDEIAELAITFNNMLNRLENSFDAQKQFVSSISHELRTPLASMLAELELALQKERDLKTYQEAIRHAMDDGKKLAKLSSNLLDFAKASYDPAEISFKEIRLDEVLMDTRTQLCHTNPEYKINLVFEQEIESDNYISINGNEYLLNVAFMNVMDNACKFSVKQECIVNISYHQTRTTIRFQDTGLGIDPSEIPNIFNTFYRGKNRHHAAGSGIGLSLTKKIVQLHQGSIEVSSVKNEGTTFTITFTHL